MYLCITDCDSQLRLKDSRLAIKRRIERVIYVSETKLLLMMHHTNEQIVTVRPHDHKLAKHFTFP